MQLAGVTAPADIAVEILEVGRLQIAPAILMHPARRDVHSGIATLLAIFEVAAERAERSAVQLKLRALIGETVLELHAQRAAQRIQAEHRVRALQVHLVNRHIGQQIEIDGVAKGLVETDAVDVDGQPLGRALQRCCLEPVINHSRLIGVARRRIEVDAADLLMQRSNGIRRGGAATRQVIAV
jgi:hypothetical protein